MTQTQFNLTEGRLRKEEGMAQVRYTLDEAWEGGFWYNGNEMAKSGQPFCAEDIVAIIGPHPKSPNAIGAAMNSLARELKLTKVGYRPAKRPSRHASVVAVWQLK